MTATIPRSVAHATFTVERLFPVPVEKVWHAFADPAAKHVWFGSDENFDTDEDSDDFRVGGKGVNDGRWHDGPRSRYEGTYTDIVEHERIVTTYDMWVDDVHLSTSVATQTFTPVDGGTLLTYTEQGVWFDGVDNPAQRETGMGEIFGKLERFLTA